MTYGKKSKRIEKPFRIKQSIISDHFCTSTTWNSLLINLELAQWTIFFQINFVNLRRKVAKIIKYITVKVVHSTWPWNSIFWYFCSSHLAEIEIVITHLISIQLFKISFTKKWNWNLKQKKRINAKKECEPLSRGESYV